MSFTTARNNCIHSIQLQDISPLGSAWLRDGGPDLLRLSSYARCGCFYGDVIDELLKEKMS
jgi:hypothetical protein